MPTIDYVFPSISPHVSAQQMVGLLLGNYHHTIVYVRHIPSIYIDFPVILIESENPKAIKLPLGNIIYIYIWFIAPTQFMVILRMVYYSTYHMNHFVGARYDVLIGSGITSSIFKSCIFHETSILAELTAGMEIPMFMMYPANHITFSEFYKWRLNVLFIQSQFSTSEVGRGWNETNIH